VTSKAAAKRRLADEYDAAQERGEVARGRPKSIPGGNTSATTDELGLTSKEIYEDRRLRVAGRPCHSTCRRLKISTSGLLWSMPSKTSEPPASSKLPTTPPSRIGPGGGGARAGAGAGEGSRPHAGGDAGGLRGSRLGGGGEGLGQVAPAGFSGGSSAKRPRYSASGQTPRRRGSLPRGRGADPTPFYGTVLLLKAKGPGPARARIGCYPRRYPEITAGCKLGAISDLCS
jgi:hypothetical protein